MNPLEKACSAPPDWIPLLVPSMPSPQELLPWLERMYNSGHYSNFGPLVRELEAAFAQSFKLPQQHVTTVANATAGLELVLQALQLPPQSRVLVPTLTFVATATAVLRAGHVPVLADVDAKNWLLTPEIALAACGKTRLDAVLPVATFGMPHDMEAWQRFENSTGLPVVIDAAAAYGSQWLNGANGTLVFSLHTTKSLPAGEGGLIVSSRPDLVAKVRQLSNFGINLVPSSHLPVGTIAGVGTNAKMSEYHAAVGLVSLQNWERNALSRRALHADLADELNEASEDRLGWQAEGPSGPTVAPTLLCVSLPHESAREALEKSCRAARVMTRRWYQPLLQRSEVLRQQCIVLEAPNALHLEQRLLGLPFFLGIAPHQRRRMCDALVHALDAWDGIEKTPQ